MTTLFDTRIVGEGKGAADFILNKDIKAGKPHEILDAALSTEVLSATAEHPRHVQWLFSTMNGAAK